MACIDPTELQGYIRGIKDARNIASQYKGVDMENYIGHLNEVIDHAEYMLPQRFIPDNAARLILGDEND